MNFLISNAAAVPTLPAFCTRKENLRSSAVGQTHFDDLFCIQRKLITFGNRTIDQSRNFIAERAETQSQNVK